MGHTHDMTVGNPTRSILHFALPMIGGYLLQQMYTVVDAAIVGQCIGVGALAAVGASWSVMFLIMGFCNGTCAGFAIPVAQAFGAHDFTTLRQYAAQSFRLTATTALLITAVAALFCHPIMHAIRIPSDIYGDAHTFLLLQLLSIPFVMAYNLLASLLRALGNSRWPFYFLVMASMLNIALSLLFIVVLGMGVAGVGLATMAAQAAAAIACWTYIRRHARLLIPKGDEWQYNSKQAKHLLANGIPMGLQFSITGIGIIMLQTANNALGTLYITSFTVSMRVKYLFTCVFENIGAAMATYCGQNIGAKRLDRVRRGEWAAVRIMLVFFVFSALIIFPFATDMMELFVNGKGQEVADNAAMIMRISCYFYPVLGMLTIFRYSIQGLGYSNLSMLSGVMEMIARSGVSLWLVPAFGFLGVCYGDPMAWVFADLFLFPAFFLLYRHLKKVVG